MEGDDFNKAAKKDTQPIASDYLNMLDDEDDLSEEQKLELLEVLFNIMKSFVMMGYSMEPVNKLIEEFQLRANEPVDLIICDKEKEITHE